MFQYALSRYCLQGSGSDPPKEPPRRSGCSIEVNGDNQSFKITYSGRRNGRVSRKSDHKSWLKIEDIEEASFFIFSELQNPEDFAEVLDPLKDSVESFASIRMDTEKIHKSPLKAIGRDKDVEKESTLIVLEFDDDNKP